MSDQEIMDSVVNRIKELMQEKNMTQAKLANCSGISMYHINRVFNRKTNAMRLTTFWRIVKKGLGVPFTEFFSTMEWAQ